MTESERDALRTIDCDTEQDHDIPKSIAVAGLIFILVVSLLIKG